jgi:hypothetical protein
MVTCGSWDPVVVVPPTARLGVDGRGLIELCDVVGGEVMVIEDERRFGVNCTTGVETEGLTGRICVDIEVVVVVVVVVATVRVDDAAGIKTVRVEMIVDMATEKPCEILTPPSPRQSLSGVPFGQHPYLLFGRRLQKVLRGQPPLLSGQHVADRAMHIVPQSFRPSCEQRICVP